MFDRAALKLAKPALAHMAGYAAARRITPDQVSLAGLGLGLLSALLVALGAPVLALLPMAASRIADGLDGELARNSGAQSDRGAFVDIAFDFIFYASIPLAFAVHDPARNALAGAFLLAAFVTTGTSFLAYASLAAKRGETSAAYPTKGIYYLGGLTEGSETIGLFIICCLWPSWFPALAGIFGLMCLVTTGTRLKAGWERFGAMPKI